MFVQSLIGNASAATAAAPQMDPQTLMYVVGGIVSGILLGIGGLFAKKAPPNGLASKPDVEQAQVFFQGPFQALLDKQNATTLALERLVGLNAETREHFADLLRSTRHDLKNALQVLSQEQEKDSEEIKRLLHEQDSVLGRLDEFLRARVK